MSWEKVKLGDIAEFSNGINFGKEAYAKGIKLIGVSNFGNRFYPDYDELEEVREDVVRENDCLKSGDIVFVRSNGNKELVGRCMLIKEPPTRVTFSGFCIRARLMDLNNYNPMFWCYHFKNKVFRQVMSGTAIGANIQNLSQGRLAAYEADIPDFDTQNRIAEILSKYDELIENNNRQIKLLEEAAQRLYKEWFVNLKFPNYEKCKIVDGVPEGWKKDTVGSIVSLLSGYAFKSSDFNDEGKYKIVTIKNVQDGVFERRKVNRVVDIPKKMPEHCRLFDGDILVSLTGNVGRVCLVYGDDYLLNQRVAKLESKYIAYAYSLFRSKEMFIEMNNLANGVAQQNLSPIKTEKLKILIPSSDLLEKYEKLVKPFIATILLLSKQNEYIKQVQNRLLPKLMEGEIEV